MNEAGFAELRAIKASLIELEAQRPMDRRVKALHAKMLSALYRLRGASGLTDDQFAELASDPTVEGGGRPKTPPEDP